ncbi:MAG: serine/threonine protein kinase [Planctomycetes bacterium]|nr:serine/threonine protein kinase [Planctomycetota bacterium]
MKFTYQSGHKPLPGYTIKRGVGQGAFGEVYFAVTDGGKQVALKLIHHRNLEKEMRGIQQGLNLKHQNLVHLYDVRTDELGQHWLIMEYVGGEPLSAILARHPNGVSKELAVEWFQGLAQAVAYLHQHGILHRDLKPANIFLENGLIKVGDFGLCKIIAESNQAAMTGEVGTAPYMAPEIGKGVYKECVDIYAAGVVLYELLTGRVPFEGQTVHEILSKHLSDLPDLSKVPVEFMRILQRALAKDPAHRYATIVEMAKDVASALPGSEPWRDGGAGATQPVDVNSDVPMVIPATPSMIFQERWSELSGILLTSIVLAAVLAVAWPLFFGRGDYSKLAPMFFLVLAASFSVLIPSKLWVPEPEEDSWTRRLVLMSLGFTVALLGLWLEGYELPLPWLGAGRLEVLQPWQPATADLQTLRGSWTGWLYGANTSMPILACYLSYFGLVFLVLRWWKITEVDRPARFSIKSLIAVAFWGYVLLFLLPGPHHREIGFLSVLFTSVVCQVACPWKEKTPLKAKKKLRLATA